MYHKILGVAVLILSLFFNQSAFAHMGGCGEGMQKMIESLNLDDAQKQKIKPILEQLKATMQKDGIQMMDISKQMHQQVQSATMNQDTMNSLIDQKTKLIGDMMKAKMMAKNQIFNILTDAQKSKWQNMMMQWEQKMADKYKNCHEHEAE